MAVVTLQQGHVQPVWAGHPWVYAQAVARVEGGATAGDEVDVVDPHGKFLGRGLYSPGSAIPVRLYTRQQGTQIDAQLFKSRIHDAIVRRRSLGLPSSETNVFRMINAEGDDLPGLVVDSFSDVLVVQFGTIGMKRREAHILDALGHALSPRAIVDRTSERMARAEGFEPGKGIVRGDTELGELTFAERRLLFRVPLELGQKTGFYADQRVLRARVEMLSRGRRVLDAHCYVGAFALAAARGGAEQVHAVDANALALEVAAECATANGLSDRIHFERGDARHELDRAHGAYDLVVVDPPKLAPSRKAKPRAMKSMRKLAAAGARAVQPGGLLVISSCSAAIDLGELTRAVALGARDVGLRPLVLERHFQAPDHPVPAAFGEGLYLNSLICEIARV